MVWAVKVVSLRDLHHAQTFRFSFVGLPERDLPQRSSSALTFAHPERALKRAAPAIPRPNVEWGPLLARALIMRVYEGRQDHRHRTARPRDRR